VAELRVLLVDDEPLVRQGICDFLEGEPDVVIVGECGNGVEALETIARERVDLVFLDIQMPELDGVGVAAALTAQDGPAVVFVTAYSEHALRAFEVNAVDYVLKPFDQERFRAALDRARARLAAGERAELAGRLAAVLAELQRSRGYAQRILVRSDGRIRWSRWGRWTGSRRPTTTSGSTPGRSGTWCGRRWGRWRRDSIRPGSRGSTGPPS
jgi:two-component system, LytTR family, response regulator